MDPTTTSISEAREYGASWTTSTFAPRPRYGPLTASEVAIDVGPLLDDLSFLLARANALSLAAGNEALVPHGLRVRSYSVLAAACAPAARTQREIAEYLRLDPSQVVALVDDLETKRLVKRVPNARDRRSNVVASTKPGRKLLTQARNDVMAAERATHATLTDSARAMLMTLLRKAAFPHET